MRSTTQHTIQTEALSSVGEPVVTCDLVVVEGPDEGVAVALEESPTTVGSLESCDLTLSDGRVSRRHLRVESEGDRFTIRDLDSENGVVYRGSLVAEASVQPGATVKIGRSYLRIQPRAEPVEVTPSQRRRFGDMVAESLSMRETFAVMELAADADCNLLITGETGTGKQLAAKAIHGASDRAGKPFVTVDCGALPENLLESELFGHVDGAFTGASGSRRGAFRRADGGTVFLDELDSMPADAQARLLRVCEEQVVRPLGADEETDVDVRIVGAGRELKSRVADGAFRSDLYYRLSVIHIEIPPLRERLEDIAPIARELLRNRGFDVEEVGGVNLERLRAHGWPGNVRELRNVLDRAVALSPGAETFEDLAVRIETERRDSPLSVRADLPFKEAKQKLVDEFEKRYLLDLYERCDGNISETARTADLNRKYLRKLLKRHNII